LLAFKIAARNLLNFRVRNFRDEPGVPLYGISPEAIATSGAM